MRVEMEQGGEEQGVCPLSHHGLVNPRELHLIHEFRELQVVKKELLLPSPLFLFGQLAKFHREGPEEGLELNQALTIDLSPSKHFLDATLALDIDGLD